MDIHTKLKSKIATYTRDVGYKPKAITITHKEYKELVDSLYMIKADQKIINPSYMGVDLVVTDCDNWITLEISA